MAPKTKHGDAIEGQRTRLYETWRGIRQRCSNPKATNYSDYGGRGISVCPEWATYAPFKEWALSSGYTDQLTIDRKDVNGDYEPSNCVWADNTVQACNKRKRAKAACSYIGVAPNKSNWQAYVTYRGKRTQIGTFTDPVDAAKARDSFVLKNRLPHRLNF